MKGLGIFSLYFCLSFGVHVFCSVELLRADPTETIGEPTSSQVDARVDSQVDSDDALCADLMVKVFHAYVQASNHEAFDFKASTIRHKYFGTNETHFPLEDTKWDQWQFKLLHKNPLGKTKHLSSDALMDNPVVGLVAFQLEQKKMVIAYRGSQEAKDWFITNFRVSGVEAGLPGLTETVHSGYWNLFESSRLELSDHVHEFMAQLTREELKEVRILLTGHSLGGAVATLAGAYLSTLFEGTPFQVDIRTFGSPRVGGPRFKKWMESRIHGKRFIRKTDPFTRIAPDILGYTDVFPSVVLPSFGAGLFQFDLAHDARLYQRAVYELLKLPYKEMYSK